MGLAMTYLRLPPTLEGETDPGRISYLTPDRVKPAADHLASTDFGAIAGRYNVKQMASLDVQGVADWSKDARDRTFKPVYEALTGFYAAAATEGQAIFKTMA